MGMVKRLAVVVSCVAVSVLLTAATYSYSGSVDKDISLSGCSGCGSSDTNNGYSSNLTYGSSQAVSGTLTVSAVVTNSFVNWDSSNYCSSSSNCYADGEVDFYYSTNSGSSWTMFSTNGIFSYGCTGDTATCGGTYSDSNSPATSTISSGTVTNLNTLYFRCYAYAENSQDGTSGNVPSIESYCNMKTVTVTTTSAAGNKVIIFPQ